MSVRRAGRGSAWRQLMHLVKAPGNRSRNFSSCGGQILAKSGRENHAQGSQYDSSTPNTVAEPLIYSSHMQFLPFSGSPTNAHAMLRRGPIVAVPRNSTNVIWTSAPKMPEACFGEFDPRHHSEVKLLGRETFNVLPNDTQYAIR